MLNSLDKAIEVLNRALEKDPEAIRKFFKLQVACNTLLADDQDIQVKIENGQDFIRPLGVINGLFGAAEDGFGKIVAICSNEGDVQHFVKYDPKVHNFSKP